MASRNHQKWIVLVLTMLIVAITSLLPASATTVSVLDEQVSIADSANSNTVSGGIVTIQAKGSLFSKKTNTVTITNETNNMAQLSFDYTASTYNSFTIAGASAAASGSYRDTLDAGASVTLVLTSNSGLSNTTATLTLSNFVLAELVSADVTIMYDNSLGSVTADNDAIDPNYVKENASEIQLVATEKNDSRFLGWIDTANNIVLSNKASFTYKTTMEITIKAVFAKDGGTPWFGVGAATKKSQSTSLLGLSSFNYYTAGIGYLFDDLNAAATFAAANSTNKTIVLMNSGTLPAGDYTVPAGVTLLIPFDDANTLYTTAVQSTDKYTTPTEYRTLTLADGAKLAINGSLSLSAKQRYSDTSGAYGSAPTGPVSFVRMDGNSSITVNNGGNLYAYGFITGSGSVTANSGATVYEMFQFMDFRGGTQSTDMDYGVFPFSQYYIQNIEVPLTLYAGAKEYAYMTIFMSSTDFGSAMSFVGSSGAMFNLEQGSYFVKTYDGSTDRLIMDIYGNVTLASIEMRVGTSSIQSKNYELPINGNISVNVHNGNASIGQDLALLPGSKIVIDAVASCVFLNGVSVYVYDADEWGTFAYCGAGGKNVMLSPVVYAPGREYTRTEADVVDASICINGTLDASSGYLYCTASGANIYSTGSGALKIQKGTQTDTYQLVQNTEYTKIPLSYPKLKNADDSYTDADSTNQYKYIDGVWEIYVPDCKHAETEIIPAVEATCTTDGLTGGFRCVTCKSTIIKPEIVPALGHAQSGEGERVSDPSCNQEGVHSYTCSVCGEKFEVAVDKLPHTEVVDAAVAPTCTETGLTEGKYCSVCGEVLAAQEDVPALGHDYKAVVTAPTCTEKGYTTHTCSACGDSYTDNETAATGHTAKWVTEGDYKTGNCSVCSESMGKKLAATANASFAVQDYLWYNGWISFTGSTDKVWVTDSNGTKLEEIQAVHSTADDRIYVVRKMPSNEISNTYSFVLWVKSGEEEIASDVFEINFTAYSINLSDAEHEHSTLASVMTAYGEASKVYFAEGEVADEDVLQFSKIVVKGLSDEDVIPKSETLTASQPIVAYKGAYINTTGATVYFDECLSLSLNFKVINVDNLVGTVTKIGLLVGDDLNQELTCGTQTKTYVLYGPKTSNNGENNNPGVGGIASAGSNGWTETMPELSDKMCCAFDLASLDYTKRFALRAFIILVDENGNEQIMYGGQYAYGLEDYVARQYDKTSSNAFKNLLVETWHYALEAKRTFSTATEEN